MRRTASSTLTSFGVLGLAGALLLAGGVFGSPAPTPPTAESQTAPARTLRPVGLAGVQRAAEQGPLDPQRWAELGLAYVTQARLTADPQWYVKAEEALERSLALRSEQNALAFSGQAALAAGRHQFKDALRLANKALGIDAFSPVAYGVKIDALTALGRYEQAFQAAGRLLEFGPSVGAYSRLSFGYELRGDTERARLALQAALQQAWQDSDKAFVQYYLGELAFRTGDLARAARHYDAALVADPTYAAALAGKGKVLAAQGQTKAALKQYRTAVTRLPQPSYLAQFGEVLEAAGRQDLAEEQYEIVRILQQAYVEQGSNVDSELALFEANHGDPAAALRLSSRAYRDRPEAVKVQDVHAWALHVNGRDAQALPIARAAVRLGWRNPRLYAHLGIIEAAAGNEDRARAALTRALDLNPRFDPLLAPRAAAVLRTLS